MREGSNKLRRLGFAAAFLYASSVPAWGQSSPACGTPTALDDGWTIATTESVGLNSAPLCAIASGMQWDENRDWNDPKNDEPHLGSEADPIRYILSRPIAKPPGSLWTYNGGGTDLLGNVLERISGKPLEAFAREVLFQPLGITDF